MEALDPAVRWRMILGKTEDLPDAPMLEGEAQAIDEVLTALYNEGSKRGGLEDSAPLVHRWLGDIRHYFPSTVVQLLQRDALDRLGLTRMLLEPELLDLVVPNVHLVATLLSLQKIVPDQSRESARALVRRYAEALQKQLRTPMQQTVRGSLYKLHPTRRPKYPEIDWHKTIRANLRHYQPKWKTIIPAHLLGHRKQSRQLRQLFLLLDQSGSMASSVIHAGIIGSILASLPALRTRLVVFDTQVVDLSHLLGDPVDLLFALQLGGGTNIGQALTYTRQLIDTPKDSILVLVSDLIEGGPSDAMMQQIYALQQSGVQVIVLLALNNEGTPVYDHDHATQLAALHIPVFACTPDRFPDLMAAALENRDLSEATYGKSGLSKKN